MQPDSRIQNLHEQFRGRRLSPVELAKSHLKAIKEHDQETNAFCHVDEAVTIGMAEDAEARYRNGAPLGVLDGIPLSIKDTLNVAGWPTRRGSRTSPIAPVAEDAISVRRLREAGAVFIGKTTTPEFAWKGITDSPLTGITRNPRDLARTAGGSSGGAAAAMALGLGALAIGSDAAGSVRIPAAFCGVVGFKPTFGRIPLDPYPAGFGQIPHIGPIAATVTDIAIGAAMMAGPDAADWTSLRQANLSDMASCLDGPLDGIRVGVQAESAEPLAPEVAPAWQEFLAALCVRFNVRTVQLPFREARDVVGLIYRIGCADAVGRVTPDRRHELEAELLEFIEPVRLLTGEQVIALYKRREELAAMTAMSLRRDVDVVISPTMGVPPPFIEDLNKPGASRDWLDWNLFTPLFNLVQGPAVSVPWQSRHNLPIGIQIAGAPGSDTAVLAVAREVERLATAHTHPGQRRS